MTVESITTFLVEGDLFEPDSNDLIAQVGRLDVGKPVPQGWRVTTGNMHSSEVVRIFRRWEMEE